MLIVYGNEGIPCVDERFFIKFKSFNFVFNKLCGKIK